MLLTRCTACGSHFRITPEQLRLRNGQVRCGQCAEVFNALEFLAETSDDQFAPQSLSNEPWQAPPVPTLQRASHAPATPAQAPSLASATPDKRDDAPFYIAPDDWSDARSNRFSQEEEAVDHPKRWPYILSLVLLLILLTGQLIYAFRTPLASNSAIFSTAFEALSIKVPLPRLSEWIAIDASDLQIDPQGNSYQLSASVKNRAPYNQDWPALELTLTDSSNAILSRRVLSPREYLPTDAPPALPARSEQSFQLRLDAEGLAAANYRVYVFYP